MWKTAVSCLCGAAFIHKWLYNFRYGAADGAFLSPVYVLKLDSVSMIPYMIPEVASNQCYRCMLGGVAETRLRVHLWALKDGKESSTPDSQTNAKQHR